MAHLTDNSYGKQRVRLTKVNRADGAHRVHEYTVDITLRGDFATIYTDDDNSPCVPTDTMKNTVYAVARLTDFDAPEEFGIALCDRFITRFSQVSGVEVSIVMERWERIAVEGRPHDYSFVKEHGKRTATVGRATGTTPSGAVRSLSVRGGISGLEVFKSSGSGFSGFYRDEYTTLPETDERIFATTVEAHWDIAEKYTPVGSDGTKSPDWNAIWSRAYDGITAVFATHESPSVQATLYRMGERVLAEVPEIDGITFTMPNQHHIPFDLAPFGLDNPGEIYYGTDSPFGIITGTVSREEKR